MQLRSPQPPRLPDPAGEYSAGYFSQLLNVLRLYFNQIGNAIGALLGPLGGTYVQSAYAEYVSTQTQTVAVINTAYAITFNTTVFENGISLASGSQITVERPGIYRITLSLQFSNNDTSIQNAGVWFRRNGTDVANSRGRFSLTEQHGGNPGHSRRDLTYTFECNEGDVLEAYWFATDTDVSLEYLPAATGPVRPAAPSATIAIAFVSADVTL